MRGRRGVGVGAIKKKQEREERYAQLADRLEATQEAHVAEFLGSFKVALEAFAAKHKKKIRSDPLFRSRFTAMCAEIGVDPLQSSKGFWSEALGVGDYFFELGVKVIEACAASRDVNGGLLTLEELAGLLEVTKDDLRRAVAKLAVLGSGFRIVDDLVLSVPVELNDDHSAALDEARRHRGVVSSGSFRARLGAARADTALDQLLRDGFAWLDSTHDGPAYYFPSIWIDAHARLDDDDDESPPAPQR
mmetsp:Transcript_17116/g.52005  ORF Transcript_17116/g.52005 Transcript_17116/m.52005 type:complete len:247 (-) Transcript_17116:1536-2276(-)